MPAVFVIFNILYEIQPYFVFDKNLLNLKTSNIYKFQMNKNIHHLLIDRAKKAQSFAQAKYSDFLVGAAILTKNNEIFTGCNIESSSYGLTICAERVAMAKALSEGFTSFKSIAIVGPGDEACPPCGSCRQFLYDYAPEIDVILLHQGIPQVYPLIKLLPLAFEEKRLHSK